MESLSTAQHVENLTEEYRTLVGRLQDSTDDAQLHESLVRDAEWTHEGAQTIVMLAERYGSFVLSNALALAEAMDIEDGSAGL